MINLSFICELWEVECQRTASRHLHAEDYSIVCCFKKMEINIFVVIVLKYRNSLFNILQILKFFISLIVSLHHITFIFSDGNGGILLKMPQRFWRNISTPTWVIHIQVKKWRKNLLVNVEFPSHRWVGICFIMLDAWMSLFWESNVAHSA